MTDIHGYVGAYVTNALDDEFRILFAEHLPDCDSCSREVQEFNETLALVSALPAARPPPSLRAAILDSISRIRIIPPTDGDDRPRHRPARPRPGRWLNLAAAASLVSAIMVGGWAVLQQQRIEAIVRAQSAAQPEAELLQAADLTTYPFSWPDGTEGAYLVSRSQGRVMITGAVPAADPGRTYQLWSMRYGRAEPGPTFRAGATRVWEIDLTGVRAIAITSEPDGGSPRPTTRLVETQL